MAFYTGLNALHEKGISSYLQRPCAVCNNTGHAFQGCPLLQNSALVATAYGKLKTKLDNLCRYKDSVNQSLSNPHSTSDVPVHSLQSPPTDSNSSFLNLPDSAVNLFQTASFHSADSDGDTDSSGSTVVNPNFH